MYVDPAVPYLLLDFETDTEEYGSATNTNNSLVLACWKIVYPDGTEVRKHKFGNEYEMYELLDDIKKVKFIVAHHLKFELQWLKRCGAELRDILGYDTLLGEWVLDGNQRKPRDLDTLAAKYGVPPKLDLVKQLIKVGWPVRSIKKEWLLSYCGRDVDTLHGVFLKQREVVKENNLLHIVHVRNLTCSVLADIEFEGMTLDREMVLQEYDRVLKESEEARLKLDELSGGINLNSGKQLGDFLYTQLGFEEVRERGKVKRTAKDAPKTDAGTLLKLAVVNEQQQEFLDTYKTYNKLSSALSKYLQFFKGVVEEKNARFFAVFNQNITKTHRLSSSGKPLIFKNSKKAKSAQFQNLPRAYKRFFWAGMDGWDIGEHDAAQLEFRVAADLGHDQVAIDEISNWVDIHSITAQTLSEAGEATNRQQAKSRTFTPLFLGKGKTKAEKVYSEFFMKKYKAINDTQTTWLHQVVANKHLVTPYGMKYYWPGCKMDAKGYIEFSTEIANAPIQGFATAEIIPIALVFFWHRTRDLPIRILNTIHDSIISAVRSDIKEQYHEVAKQSMTFDVMHFLKDVYNYDFLCPMGVGIKVSRNWADTKEESIYNCFRDGRSLKKE